MIGCVDRRRSRLGRVGTIVLAMATGLTLVGPACAQSGEPIKIGYSMSLTGGLAPNGRSALLAQRIWEVETNAKGGMLGRPVKLIYYDDKSSPSEIPSIYTKLLDIDKVDLIIGAYGTALTAPAMPIVIQRKKTFIGLLGLAVNSQFNYPNYFVMGPYGPDAKPAFTEGFFDAALLQNPKPQTVAIVAADQEFSRNAAEGARENLQRSGLKLVYERAYPPATLDFAPIVRAIAAASPDLVVVCSYPPDSVGMVRAVNELRFKPKAIGGAMIGLQSTPVKAQLGPLLNGFIGEFTILQGAFQVSKAWAAWGSLGVVLGAAYLLWLYQRVMFGPVTQFANEDLPDLNLREYATLVPLVILAFWIGIYPKPFFALIEKPVQKIVEQVNPNFYQAERAKLPPAEFHAAAAETK